MTQPSHPDARNTPLNYGRLALILAGLIAMTLLIGSEQQGVTYVGNETGQLPNGFWAALQTILVVSILIERTVGVFLLVTEQDPTRMLADDGSVIYKTSDPRRPATMASVVLGVVAAAAGARILGELISVQPCTAVITTQCVSTTSWFMFRLTDIAISAGLLAGGAQMAHPLMTSMIDLLSVLRQNVRGEATGFRLVPEVFEPRKFEKAMFKKSDVSYIIRVKRGKKESGTLTFRHGDVDISTTCWWDSKNRIKPGIYETCSATRMAHKTDPKDETLKRMGIYLPDAKSPKTGNADIFIHEGDSAAWSDGCIIIVRAEMEKIWTAIDPKDGYNVKVVVEDA